MRRRRWSLRLRITAGALVVVIAGLTVAGLLVTRVVTDAMTEQIDHALVADADYAQRSTTSGRVIPPAQGPNGLYVQLVDLSTVQAVGFGSKTKDRPPLMRVDQRVGTIATVDDPVLGPVRSIVVAGPTGSKTVLVLARSSGDVRAVATRLKSLVVVLILVGSALLGLVIWWVVGRSLRPVEQMRRQVDGLQDRDLTNRIALPGTRDELDRLAVTLNELLGRLQAAIDRERRFVADASHDLRTPVAAMKVLLETGDDEPGDASFIRAETLARVEELQELIDRLLELSASDRAAETARDPVDLDDIVLAQAARLARSDRLHVDTSAVSGGQVAGNLTDLGRVVANLAANAARYAATTVRFVVRTRGEIVELVVEDDGPGIPLSDRERIFERFATLDDARNRQHSGAGLGLSITAGLVALHRGRITVDDVPGGGARFTVTFPAFMPSDRAEMPVGSG
ncbi:MAG: HAMP domain-containing histidine kinase [Acidimicrobiales bacterium]|nr:HAMP domain-containing histidine kinase [Acidimicrobiales bacterium]